MWYRTSLKRLETAVMWPALATTIIVVFMFILGLRSWAALLGVWIVTFP